MKEKRSSKRSGRAKSTARKPGTGTSAGPEPLNAGRPVVGRLVCAPGLRLSSIARWPCPGCEVGAKVVCSQPADCPFESAAV